MLVLAHLVLTSLPYMDFIVAAILIGTVFTKSHADLLQVSHSRGTAWRLSLSLRAKVLGTLGSGYIERQFLIQFNKEVAFV